MLYANLIADGSKNHCASTEAITRIYGGDDYEKLILLVAVSL